MERDIFYGTPTKLNFISTHTLTWSVTVWDFEGVYSKFISTHTLTWSVTLEYSDSRGQTGNFNSHAHVERDIFDGKEWNTEKISTHTLTWSVTRFCDWY